MVPGGLKEVELEHIPAWMEPDILPLTVLRKISGTFARNSKCLSDSYSKATHDSLSLKNKYFFSRIRGQPGDFCL